MSQSPLDAREEGANRDRYLENWNRLARRIREGASFSGRERNCGFLNTGATRFADVSSALGLDWPDDGRGLAVVDWDQDGDLDFWLANRTAPSVRFLENRLAPDAGYLALQLQGTSVNRDAIGARVEVRLAGDSTRHVRSLRAGEGFLSQSSKLVHFGLGGNTRIEEVAVTWPGASEPQRFRGLAPNHRYRLIEGQSEAVPLPSREKLSWDERLREPAVATGALPAENTRRVILTQRRPLPPIEYESGDGMAIVVDRDAGEGPQLLTLWASWCAPCLREMQDLAAARERLSGRVDVLALSVDALPGADSSLEASSLEATTQAAGERGSARDIAQTRIQQLNWPFAWGFISQDSLRAWTELDHSVFYRTRALPLPCSLLVDSQGRVAAIYKGALAVSQLEDDLQRLAGDASAWREAASPLGGRSIASWFSPDRAHVAQAYLEGGYQEDARRELDRFFSEPPEAGRGSRTLRALAWRLRGELAQRDADVAARFQALREVVREQPDSLADRAELAVASQQAGPLGRKEADSQLSILARGAEANAENAALLVQTHLRRGEQQRADAVLREALGRFAADPRLRYMAAMNLLGRGETDEAINALRSLVADRPELRDAANDLAWLLAQQHVEAGRVASQELDEALRLADGNCAATRREDPQFLDTLARILAVRGDWQEAATVAEEARRLAAARGDDGLSLKLQRRRDEYRSQRIGD